MATGRPTKLTNELIKKVCGRVRMGMYFVTACKVSGIAENTFYYWKRKALLLSELSDEEQKQLDKDDKRLLKFLQSLKEAEAEAELKLLMDIQKDPSWQSKAWILERRNPQHWAKQEYTKDAERAKMKSPEESQVEDMSLEEIEQRLKSLDRMKEDYDPND